MPRSSSLSSYLINSHLNLRILEIVKKFYPRFYMLFSLAALF